MLLYTSLHSDGYQLLAVVIYSLETWNIKSWGLVPFEFVAQSEATVDTFYSLRVVLSLLETSFSLRHLSPEQFSWQ